MADDQFRQAFGYFLVDKENLYRVPLWKDCISSHRTPLPSSSDFALDKSVHEFNVEKAKELLDEAGYKKRY